MAEPIRVGPYRLEELVGRGGMGAVYRAAPADGGDDVAVKIVTASAAPSLRREIAALSRLRHPGVVRILAHGVDEGTTWLAMELFRGTSLRCVAAPGALSASADTATLEPLSHAGEGATPVTTREGMSTPRTRIGDVTPLLTAVRRLCVPLAYMHGEGLVHGDLKPDNVLLGDDGMPVLVDFGLASAFAGGISRESLQAWRAAGGTLAYVSPEQAQGDPIDARADMFSLGCILYELLTGCPPLLGSSPSDVLRRRLHEAPVPPSALVDGIPADLEDLVTRLMAPIPGERIGHASDVAARLVALGASAEDHWRAPVPPAKSYLYRPAVIGRDGLLTELRAHIDGARRGRGRFIAVSGASGSGKTRLALELARSARSLGLQVLVGEAAPPLAGAAGAGNAALSPFQPILEELADRLRRDDGGDVDPALWAHLRVLAPVTPALASVLGGAAPPAALPTALARTRLQRAVIETLLGMAARTPTLLVLDDLQWADDLTLDVLAAMASGESLGRSALFVLGSFRPEDAPQRLADLVRSSGVELRELGGLEPEAAERMAADMLSLPALPARLRDAIVGRAGGNPFFVGERLRAAVSAGILGRDERGTWVLPASGEVPSVPLPGTIRELVQSRLAALPASAADVVRLASVAGREVAPTLLASASGTQEEEQAGDVALLVARQLLEEREPGRLRFLHDGVREAIYESIDGADLPGLHRRIARALAARPADLAVPRDAALGHHWEMAGEPALARASYLTAARAAEGRDDYREAERLYRSYLRLDPPEGAERGRAHFRLGYPVLFNRGQRAEALSELQSAREDLPRHEPAALPSILRALAVVTRALGQAERARSLLKEALEAASARGDAREAAAVILHLEPLHRELGEHEPARQCAAEARTRLHDLGDAEGEARALAAQAIQAHEAGRVEEARALYQEALVLHRSAGDRLGEAGTLGNLANLLLVSGDLAGARVRYREALALQRAIGNAPFEGIVLGNLSELHRLTGQTSEAWETARRSVTILREVADPQALAVALLGLAELHVDDGSPESARPLLEEALVLAREIGSPFAVASIQASLARVEAAAGKHDAARDALETALQAMPPQQHPREHGLALAFLSELDRQAGRCGIDHALQAVRLVESSGDALGLAQVLVEAGRAALAASRDPHDWIRRARATLDPLALPPDAPLSRDLAALEREATGVP